MTEQNIPRRKILGLGALAASGSLSGCLLSVPTQTPTDISSQVSTHPADGVSLTVLAAGTHDDPLFGNKIELEVGVNSRGGGEHWVRMAVVWDGATRASDTETVTLVPGETAAVDLYKGVGAELDEIEDILVGAGPAGSNENPFAQEADR